jgi:hypothetical protein
MGDMADAQRVVSLSCQRMAARHEFVPFDGYEPFRAASSSVAAKRKQPSRDECLARAGDCRPMINGQSRIPPENMV